MSLPPTNVTHKLAQLPIVIITYTFERAFS